MGDVYRQVDYGVYIVRTSAGLNEAAARHFGRPCNPRQPGGYEPTFPCVVEFHGQLGTRDHPYFYWYEVDKFKSRLEKQLTAFDNF